MAPVPDGIPAGPPRASGPLKYYVYGVGERHLEATLTSVVANAEACYVCSIPTVSCPSTSTSWSRRGPATAASACAPSCGTRSPRHTAPSFWGQCAPPRDPQQVKGLSIAPREEPGRLILLDRTHDINTSTEDTAHLEHDLPHEHPNGALGLTYGGAHPLPTGCVLDQPNERFRQEKGCVNRKDESRKSIEPESASQRKKEAICRSQQAS